MTESEPTEKNAATPSPSQDERQRKVQYLLARAMKDEVWRQELLTNPKAVLEHELGITIPQGVTIAIHEATPTTVHLLLPPRVLPEVEVSDADLSRRPLDCEPGCATYSLLSDCLVGWV